MSQEHKFRGASVYFDGKLWVVPPLGIQQFEEHYEVLTSGARLTTREELFARFKAVIPVIGDALRRNYPETSDEYLLSVIDLRTFPELLKAIQNEHGLEAAPGEA